MAKKENFLEYIVGEVNKQTKRDNEFAESAVKKKIPAQQKIILSSKASNPPKAEIQSDEEFYSSLSTSITLRDLRTEGKISTKQKDFAYGIIEKNLNKENFSELFEIDSEDFSALMDLYSGMKKIKAKDSSLESMFKEYETKKRLDGEFNLEKEKISPAEEKHAQFLIDNKDDLGKYNEYMAGDGHRKCPTELKEFQEKLFDSQKDLRKAIKDNRKIISEQEKEELGIIDKAKEYEAKILSEDHEDFEERQATIDAAEVLKKEIEYGNDIVAKAIAFDVASKAVKDNVLVTSHQYLPEHGNISNKEKEELQKYVLSTSSKEDFLDRFNLVSRYFNASGANYVLNKEILDRLKTGAGAGRTSSIADAMNKYKDRSDIAEGVEQERAAHTFQSLESYAESSLFGAKELLSSSQNSENLNDFKKVAINYELVSNIVRDLENDSRSFEDLREEEREILPGWMVAHYGGKGVKADNDAQAPKEKESNVKDEQDVKENTDTQGESELVMELRDYAQQIGMSPTDKEFRSVAVDYIQKKAVGVLDEKAGPSRRLLDNKEKRMNLLKDMADGGASVDKISSHEMIQKARLLFDRSEDSKKAQNISNSISELEVNANEYIKGGKAKEEFYSQFRTDAEGNFFHGIDKSNFNNDIRIEKFDHSLSVLMADGLYQEYSEKYIGGMNSGTGGAGGKSLSSLISDPVGYESFFQNLENPSVGDIKAVVGESVQVEEILKNLISNKSKFDGDPVKINDYLKVQEFLESNKKSVLHKATAVGFADLEDRILNQQNKENNYKLEFSNETRKGEESSGPNGNPELMISGGSFFRGVSQFKDNVPGDAYRMLQTGTMTYSGMKSKMGRKIYNEMGLALLSDDEKEYKNNVDVLAAMKTIPQGVLLKAQFSIESNKSPTENIKTIIQILKKDNIEASMAKHIAFSNLIMINSNRTGAYEKTDIKIDKAVLEEESKNICGGSSIAPGDLQEAIKEFSTKKIADLDEKYLTILSSPAIMDYLTSEDDDDRSPLEFLKSGDKNNNRAFLNKMKDLARASRGIDNQKEAIERNPLGAREHGNNMNRIIPEENEVLGKKRNQLKKEDDEFAEDSLGKWKDPEFKDLEDSTDEKAIRRREKITRMSNNLRAIGSTSTNDLNKEWSPPGSLNVSGGIGTVFGLLKDSAMDIGTTLLSGETSGRVRERLKKSVLNQTKLVGAAAFNNMEFMRTNKFVKGILPDSWNQNFQKDHSERALEQKEAISAYTEMFNDMQDRKVAEGVVPDHEKGKNIDFANLDSAYPNYYGDSVPNDFIAGKVSPSFYLGAAMADYSGKGKEKGYFGKIKASVTGGSFNVGEDLENPLGLGELTPEAREHLQKKVKENEERNKNARRYMLASAVSEISPLSEAPEKNRPKAKIIDNIITASEGVHKFLDLKDLRGIYDKLMGGKGDVDHGASELEIIDALKKERSKQHRMETAGARMTSPEEGNSLGARNNEASMGNVHISLANDGGGFVINGRNKEKDKETEFYTVKGNMRNPLPEEDEEKVKALLSNVNLLDIISSASNDPARFSGHLDFVYKYMKPEDKDNKLKVIKTEENYNKILSNIYTADFGDKEKEELVKNLLNNNISDSLADTLKIKANEENAANDQLKKAAKKEGEKDSDKDKQDEKSRSVVGNTVARFYKFKAGMRSGASLDHLTETMRNTITRYNMLVREDGNEEEMEELKKKIEKYANDASSHRISKMNEEIVGSRVLAPEDKDKDYKLMKRKKTSDLAK